MQLTKLEQKYNELKANLQLSALYGKNLLEEINSHKQQIKQMQAAQEVCIEQTKLCIHLKHFNIYLLGIYSRKS